MTRDELIKRRLLKEGRNPDCIYEQVAMAWKIAAEEWEKAAKAWDEVGK